MKPFTWQEGMSVEETKDGAYWERNMLALFLANVMNEASNYIGGHTGSFYYAVCGWYLHGEYEGWSRVISLDGGNITFHVPDDFELGDLPQIEPNWDGHTTDAKWKRVMNTCGIEDTI